MREYLFAIFELLIGSRQFKRRAKMRALELAHDVGDKMALTLADTMNVAAAYYAFALTGENPLTPPAMPEEGEA